MLRLNKEKLLLSDRKAKGRQLKPKGKIKPNAILVNKARNILLNKTTVYVSLETFLKNIDRKEAK